MRKRFFVTDLIVVIMILVLLMGTGYMAADMIKEFFATETVTAVYETEPF